MKERLATKWLSSRKSLYMFAPMNVKVIAKESENGPGYNRPWTDELANTVQVPPPSWQDPDYNPFTYVAPGLLLGAVGGCTSLAANVIGSVLWPAISGVQQHPLRLIQIFLTFPLGEYALELNNGVLLALGCVLYLATGMLYGMLFVLAISYIVPRAGALERIITCTILALIVWAINFYGLLVWLQPMLLHGSWITQEIPWWVGMITHLIFGSTIAILYPIAERNPAKSLAKNGSAAS